MAIDALPSALDRLSGLAPDRKDDAERRTEELKKAAVAFEAMFLAEMLEHGGLGRAPEGFGGGHGEEAFRGELVAQQARLMAERGGIGIADTIFRAMVEREGLEP